MLSSATSNIINSQLLAPIWSTGLNAVLRRNKHVKESTKKESNVEISSSTPKAQIPFLPCYLDRMMPCVSLLSLCAELEAKSVLKQPLPSHLSKHCHLFLNSSCWYRHQPTRTFKTKAFATPEEAKQNTKADEQKFDEKKVDLTEVIKLLVKNSERKQDNSFYASLTKVLPTIIILGVIVYVVYKNVLKVNFGKSIEDNGLTSNVTFDDIRGADEVKSELCDIVEFLKDPKKFTDVGVKLPKGILLVGPPGTGKTLLAKAVAGEAGVSFFYASGSEFDELLVGMGALRVRQLFDKARKRAPAIIFLDEIDACGGKRANTTIQPYARQTINQLLQEMDGFTDNDTVVVLAATNDAKVLDKALVRPGRFDTQIQVLLPDIQGRKQILQLYLDKLSSVAAETLDLDRLASLTIEMTGADLSNLVNQAALRSVKINKKKVDQDDLEFALDKVRMGPELKTRIRTDMELKNTAFHEAGHALVAHYTPAAQNIYKATIMQRGPALGHVALVPSKEDELSRSKVKLLASIDVCMGGKVAEELIFGKDNASTGASSDLESATQLAYGIVCRFGMSEKMGPMTYDLEHLSEETKRSVENEVKAILNSAYEKARKLLTEKAFEHKLLASALLRYESLAADEIKLLLQTKAIDSIATKREKETQQKLLKKLEESNESLGLSIKAPVIDYIPAKTDLEV